MIPDKTKYCVPAEERLFLEFRTKDTVVIQPDSPSCKDSEEKQGLCKLGVCSPTPTPRNPGGFARLVSCGKQGSIDELFVVDVFNRGPNKDPRKVKDIAKEG